MSESEKRDETAPAEEEVQVSQPEADPAAAVSKDGAAELDEQDGQTSAEPAPALAAKPKAQRAKRKSTKPRAAKGRGRSDAPASDRKPIVRLPKPERARGRRKERRGVVVSDSMDKTIVVRVDTAKAHPFYRKVVRRSKKFHAHDEGNVAKVGDVVRIVETRPVSRTKHWRLAEVVEAAR